MRLCSTETGIIKYHEIVKFPVELVNGYGLFLSLYKSNLKNPLRIRFSVLVEDLPKYLKEEFSKMELRIEPENKKTTENAESQSESKIPAGV